MIRALLCALALLTLPTAALAADGGKLRVAVLDLKLQEGIPPALAEPLALALAQELEKIGPFKTVSSRDIREMVAFDRSQQLLGCTTESCLAEIGGALGVDWMVSGSVSRLGETFVMQLQMLNNKQARVVGRATREHKGAAEGLLAEIRVAAIVLVRDLLESLAGELLVTSSEEGASIKIDGAIVGVTPLAAPLPITAGPHTIEVEREGFILFKRDVSVVPRQVTEISAKLQPSREFLEAYQADVTSSRRIAWMVTGVGALALGGAVVAYVVGAGKAAELTTEVDAYNADPARSSATLDGLQSREKELGTLDAITLVSAGVGVAGVGAGAWLFATGPDPARYVRQPDAPTVRLLPAPGGLALGGIF